MCGRHPCACYRITDLGIVVEPAYAQRGIIGTTFDCRATNLGIISDQLLLVIIPVLPRVLRWFAVRIRIGLILLERMVEPVFGSGEIVQDLLGEDSPPLVDGEESSF